jgi:predicted alpha/beta superfamily hydrolase
MAMSDDLGPARPAELPRTTVHPVGHRGEPWEVLVRLPHGDAPGDGGRWPTVVLLDPRGTFLPTTSAAEVLTATTHGLLPPLAIVGIGPALPDDEVIDDAQRFRDFVPDVGPLPPYDPVQAGGGTDALLDAIFGRWLPAVEAMHPLDPSNRTIGGWSLSGLVACHALITRPDEVAAAIGVSPSLWAHDRRIIDRALALPAGHLEGRSLYLAAGEHEGPDWSTAWPTPPAAALELCPDMHADNAAFAAAVARAGATVHVDVLSDQSHGTSYFAAIALALIALHATG